MVMTMKSINRRHFLRNTAGTALALASVQSLFGAESTSPYVKNMGLQLYTLRDQIAADTAATIKAVAEAGYKQVEPYRSPETDAMIAAAKDNGLAVNSMHFDWNTIVEATDPALPDFVKLSLVRRSTASAISSSPTFRTPRERTWTDTKRPLKNSTKPQRYPSKQAFNLPTTTTISSSSPWPEERPDMTCLSKSSVLISCLR